jgi:HSP20 family protein
VDLYATQEAYILRATVPGVRPEDIDIQVEGDLVTLAVKPQAHEEGRRYLLRELPAGLVERRIRLPEAVNPSKAKAALENGLLTVRLPKAEHLLPKHIKVKAR